MAGCSHEEQHRERQKEIGPRGEKRHARHASSLWGNGRTVFRVGFRPGDKALLNAPDDSPDAEHHHPADTAANADREQAIAFPSVRIQVQEQMRGVGHDHDVENGKKPALIKDAFSGQQQRIHNRPG